jgi:hypothetical protein
MLANGAVAQFMAALGNMLSNENATKFLRNESSATPQE